MTADGQNSKRASRSRSSYSSRCRSWGMATERLFPDPNNRIVNPPVLRSPWRAKAAGRNHHSSPLRPKPMSAASFRRTSSWIPRPAESVTRQIYDEWNASSHHFGSFNNQFYRKAIEYMQDTQGSPQGSKWCAGCHDHAVFFNGRFDETDQIADRYAGGARRIGLHELPRHRSCGQHNGQQRIHHRVPAAASVDD